MNLFEFKMPKFTLDHPEMNKYLGVRDIIQQ